MRNDLHKLVTALVLRGWQDATIYKLLSNVRRPVVEQMIARVRLETQWQKALTSIINDIKPLIDLRDEIRTWINDMQAQQAEIAALRAEANNG